MKPYKKSRFLEDNPSKSANVDPHHLPNVKKQLAKAAFAIWGHNGDTFYINGKRMRPPSKPAINRENEDKYFIFWNHDVPEQLWPYYKRKRIRIKKYDDINRYKGEEREKYAEFKCKAYEHALKYENYTPFADLYQQYIELDQQEKVFNELITEKEQISPEMQRKLTPLNLALDLFIDSRKERTKNTNTISTQRGVKKWMLAYFKPLGLEDIAVSKITRLQIAEALMSAKKANTWGNTTYNNNISLAMTFFTWLETEEYIDKNPALGKLENLPEKKKKHKWYDRDTAEKVKKQLLKTNTICVYRACQFTYWLMIRSQSELLKLKFGDIDRVLKRTRFSELLSKNGMEQYRDYPPEFETVLDELNFDSFPKDWFIFGKLGLPSPNPSGKNHLARMFQPIRDDLGISTDYTIYGWKHTRIVHEMMKGTDGYQITYMARHGDVKTTDDYKRDYDFTLTNVYGPKDLTF